MPPPWVFTQPAANDGVNDIQAGTEEAEVIEAEGASIGSDIEAAEVAADIAQEAIAGAAQAGVLQLEGEVAGATGIAGIGGI